MLPVGAVFPLYGRKTGHFVTNNTQIGDYLSVVHLVNPYFSELKYLGSGDLDFIEVVVDKGLDVIGIQVVVYHPSGTVRSTDSLGTIDGTIAGKDVYVIDAATATNFYGLHQNGAVALVQDGVVLSFVSFGSTLTAGNGPAAGMTSTAVGTTGSGESLVSSDGVNFSVNPTPTPGTIPCFLEGTRIMTDRGERPVETLRPGDRVITLDAGAQPILWTGQCTLRARDCIDLSRLPVRIPAGAISAGCPSRDLYLSANHRVMLEHHIAELLYGEPEVLIPTKALVGDEAIAVHMPQSPPTYHHLLLERHHVLLAEGLASESLHPGQMAIEGFDGLARDEISKLVPCAEDYGPTARAVLKPWEAGVLLQTIGADGRKGREDSVLLAA